MPVTTTTAVRTIPRYKLSSGGSSQVDACETKSPGHCHLRNLDPILPQKTLAMLDTPPNTSKLFPIPGCHRPRNRGQPQARVGGQIHQRDSCRISPEMEEFENQFKPKSHYLIGSYPPELTAQSSPILVWQAVGSTCSGHLWQGLPSPAKVCFEFEFSLTLACMYRVSQKK